jgi:hypothetical protein
VSKQLKIPLASHGGDVALGQHIRADGRHELVTRERVGCSPARGSTNRLRTLRSGGTVETPDCESSEFDNFTRSGSGC